MKYQCTVGLTTLHEITQTVTACTAGYVIGNSTAFIQQSQCWALTTQTGSKHIIIIIDANIKVTLSQ